MTKESLILLEAIGTLILTFIVVVFVIYFVIDLISLLWHRFRPSRYKHVNNEEKEPEMEEKVVITTRKVNNVYSEIIFNDGRKFKIHSKALNSVVDMIKNSPEVYSRYWNIAEMPLK